MEILGLLIFVLMVGAAVAFFYFRQKKSAEEMAEFYKHNRMMPADDYKSALPPNQEWENLVCRKLKVPARDISKIEIHWCEYRVLTGEYTTAHNRVYVGYVIISFPKQIVTPEFTAQILQTVKKSGEKFKGELLERIQRDSERPVKAAVLPNGDLATYWISKNTPADAEFKLKWVKGILN